MAGRPKSIEQKQLLSKAVECFWRNGYLNTSVRDVALTAGVTTGTLYNEFANKDALYNAALNHYIETITQPRVDNILLAESAPFLAKGESDSAVARIRYFISSTVLGLPSSVAHQACLLVNSHIEIDDKSKTDILKTIRKGLRSIDKGFMHQLNLGYERGEFSLKPEHGVLQLNIFMTGLLLTAKHPEMTPQLQAAIDHFIDQTFSQSAVSK